MVAVTGAWREVVHLSAVDYLTNEVLIDTLVAPTMEVTDWGTGITGVDASIMSSAISSGTALHGYAAARDELFKHLDADTVLIGQSLQFDLEVLGLCHLRIVDSEMLSTSAINFPDSRRRGLKELCRVLIGLDIQGGSHSALEDARAAREVVMWMCGNAEALQEWGKEERVAEENRRALMAERRRGMGRPGRI